MAGSAATRLKRPPDFITTYRLVPHRDYIVKVNGRSVHSMDQLRQQIAASGRECMLTVYDSKTKSYGEYYAELR